MDIPQYKTALIVGAGEGLSASLARLFTREGLRVAVAARNAPRIPGTARMAPTLTTGLDGASKMMSASAIAATASVAALAFSAPIKAKLCVGTWAR